MCCETYQSDEEAVADCVCCGGGIDADGHTTERSCGYSPTECQVCGWSPCDGSC